MKRKTDWETFGDLYNRLAKTSPGKVKTKLDTQKEQKRPKPKRA